MGNTLTGQIVAETYDSLLKVTDNNQITGTKKRLTDGFGTDTPLLVSTTDVQVDGNFLIESAQFNTATIQTGGVGKLIWNDQDGTLDLGLKGGNVTLQIGQEQLTRVVNKTGSNLLESNYQAVKVDGAQGNRLKVVLAQANNDANSAETIGIVTETINNNQEGFITTSGLVRGINTTGSLQGETWSDGDMLYLSGTTAGKLTNIKPSAPTHTIIMGYVVRAHATQGEIYVKVDNGYELDELHNVSITSPSNGQVLAYDSATGLWKNSTNGNGTVTSVALAVGTSGTDVNISGSPITSNGTITLNIPTASITNRGLLSASDWFNFTNKANDIDVVHLTGNESIDGVKTFTTAVKASSNFFIKDWSTVYTESGYTGLYAGSNYFQFLRTDKSAKFNYGATAARTYTLPSTDGTLALTSQLTGGTVTSIGLTLGTSGSDANISGSPVTSSGNITLNLPTASALSRGLLSSTDWSTFNAKQSALTFGNLTESTSSVLTITGGTGAVIGSGTSIQVKQASGSQNGFLSSTDWNTFNGKVSGAFSGSYIPVANGAASLTNSVIYQNGSNNVGIGTTSPQYRLDVAGSVASSAGFWATYGGGFLLGGTSPGISYAYIGGDGDSSTASFLTLNTNGTERFRITHSGNVGIGTSSPGATLHSVSPSGVDALMLKRGVSNNWALGPASGTGDTGSFGIVDGANLRLLINSSGNVGIGTTSPQDKLHLDGNLRLTNGSGFTSANSTIRQIVAYSGSVNQFETSSINFLTSDFSDGGHIVFKTNGYSGNTERMRITSGGNVGIGTTNPQSPLSIVSSSSGILSQINTTNSASTSVALELGAYGTTFSNTGTHIRAYVNHGANTNSDLAFEVNGTTERMRITSGGNVGIGTTSVFSKFQVHDGKIQVSPASNADGGGSIYGFNDTSRGFTFEGGLRFQTFNWNGSSYAMRDMMTISGGGNVGIGTTSPQVTFHSYGGALTVGNEATYSARFSNNSNKGVLIGYDTTNNKGHIGSINPAVAWTDLILNANGGNVGIGTTSPTDFGAGSTLVTTSNSSYGGYIAACTTNTVLGQFWSNSSSVYFGSRSSHDLIITTANTEKIRVASNGNVGIGTSGSTFGRLYVYQSGLSTVPVLTLQHSKSASTTSGYQIAFWNSAGTEVGSITSNGTTTAYNISSDYRLKEDLKDFSGLSLIGNIKTYDFEWKSDKSRMYGVLAHELQEVMPYAVTGKKDGEQMQGVDYSKLVPVLVKAIQEQQAQIEELKAKLN